MEAAKGESALLVQGARRVGKSYIVEAFAKAEYKSYILIDFNLVDQPVKEMFEHDLVDLKTFFMKLTTYYGGQALRAGISDYF